jgi:hypothetical protein
LIECQIFAAYIVRVEVRVKKRREREEREEKREKRRERRTSYLSNDISYLIKKKFRIFLLDHV